MSSIAENFGIPPCIVLNYELDTFAILLAWSYFES